MDDHDDDPEVKADLELRDRTARERPRRALGEIYSWTKPAIVGQVPCRARCGALVDWPQDAEDQFAMFNRELERRGEAPLDKTRIVFCDRCRAAGTKAAADNKRKHVDQVAMLIRELRGGTTRPEPPGPAPAPERERAIVDQLRKLEHPDLDGLVRSLRESRDANGGAKAKRARSL